MPGQAEEESPFHLWAEDGGGEGEGRKMTSYPQSWQEAA